MTNFLKKIPYLDSWVTAVIILLVGVVPIINFWFFQDTIDIPKVILWFAGLGLVLFLLSKQNLLIPSNKWLLFIILTLVLFGILTTLFSLDWRNSLLGTHPRYSNSLIFSFSWLLFIFSLYFQKKTYGKFLVILIAHTSFLVGLLAIFQFFGFAYYSGTSESARELIPSLIGNPNFSAMFVVVCLPVLLFYTSTLKTFYYKVIYWFLLGINLLSLIIFNSRGAYLALILGLLVYLVLSYKSIKKKTLLWTVLLMGLFVFLGYQFYFTVRVDVGTRDQSLSELSTISRIIVWEQSFNYFERHPILGTGFGNFFLAFRQNTHPYIANQEWFDDAHNIFIQNFVTNGIFYGTAFILLILVTLFYLFKSYLISEAKEWEVVLFSSIVAWSVAASFNPVTVSLWILLGVLLGVSWKIAFKEKMPISRTYSSVILILLGILFITTATLIFCGNLFLVFAEKSEQLSDVNKQLTMSKVSVDIFPFIPKASNLRTDAFINEGKLESADQSLKENIAAHSLSSGIYEDATRLYAKMFVQSKNLYYKEQALYTLNKMVSLNANYAYVYKVASLYLYYLGEPGKALQMNTAGLVKDPVSYNAWIMRGKLYYDLNDREKAIESIKKANAISPQKNLKIFIQDMQNPKKKLDEIQFPYVF